MDYMDDFLSEVHKLRELKEAEQTISNTERSASHVSANNKLNDFYNTTNSNEEPMSDVISIPDAVRKSEESYNKATTLEDKKRIINSFIRYRYPKNIRAVNKVNEALVEEIAQLGFRDDGNPFLKFIDIGLQTGSFNIMTANDYDFIHNCYVDNIVDRYDLTGNSKLGSHNLVFNKDFYTTSYKYNDKEWLLKIQRDIITYDSGSIKSRLNQALLDKYQYNPKGLFYYFTSSDGTENGKLLPINDIKSRLNNARDMNKDNVYKSKKNAESQDMNQLINTISKLNGKSREEITAFLSNNRGFNNVN